ncbi:MAG TPA: DUF2807 domain-containing protein [Mucilaginibacter sp.]
MKKIIFTLTTIVAVVIGTANFTYATDKNITQTTLTNVGNINKIEVHGNVEVYVSNGVKDAVTVNNNYYAESAFVQDVDGVLRIASYKAEKLIVFVTASDLRTIAAYDNATVKSDGKLSLISLDVNLYNNAYAGLKLDNYTANITVNDQAKADLSGNITEYNLTYSVGSSVNRTLLVADNATENKVTPKVELKQKHISDDIAVL